MIIYLYGKKAKTSRLCSQGPRSKILTGGLKREPAFFFFSFLGLGRGGGGGGGGGLVTLRYRRVKSKINQQSIDTNIQRLKRNVFTT